MTADEVLALCRRHVEREVAQDVDGVMATMVAEPRFEFYPVRRAITGAAAVRRYYEDFYPPMATRAVEYERLGEWASESAALLEVMIGLSGSAGVERYHVLSIFPVDDGTGLFSGERLYCDEGFVRALIGDLFDELEPID